MVQFSVKNLKKKKNHWAVVYLVDVSSSWSNRLIKQKVNGVKVKVENLHIKVSDRTKTFIL